MASSVERCLGLVHSATPYFHPMGDDHPEAQLICASPKPRLPKRTSQNARGGANSDAEQRGGGSRIGYLPVAQRRITLRSLPMVPLSGGGGCGAMPGGG